MRTSHGATHRPIRNDGRRSHSRWVDPHVSYVQAHHRSDPRAGYTHTAHAACACGWGPGTMRTSHGATHRPIRNDGRRSHSRWVDPHVSYVAQAHHRSDPRAAYTHTAHAACACGWGPGTMRTVPRSPHWPGPVTVAGYSSSSCLPLPVAVPVTVTQRHWSMRPVTGI